MGITIFYMAEFINLSSLIKNREPDPSRTQAPGVVGGYAASDAGVPHNLPLSSKFV